MDLKTVLKDEMIRLDAADAAAETIRMEVESIGLLIGEVDRDSDGFMIDVHASIVNNPLCKIRVSPVLRFRLETIEGRIIWGGVDEYNLACELIKYMVWVAGWEPNQSLRKELMSDEVQM